MSQDYFRLLIRIYPLEEGEKHPEIYHVHSPEALPTGFNYMHDKCMDFYAEREYFDYCALEETIKDLKPGIYEVIGEFHHKGSVDYWGEYDEDWELKNTAVRALTEKDIKIYCPEELNGDAAQDAIGTDPNPEEDVCEGPFGKALV